MFCTDMQPSVASTPVLVLVNCRFKRPVYLHLVNHTLEVFIFQVKQFTSFGKLILSVGDFKRGS